MKKFFLLFLLAAFTAGQCLAQTFSDNGLSYTVIKDASGNATTDVQVDGLASGTEATTVTIPATANVKNREITTTYNVTLIKDGAFYQNSTITKLGLSQATKLTSIAMVAFYKCTGLESVNLSGATALTTIGTQAFCGCSNAKFTSIT